MSNQFSTSQRLLTIFLICGVWIYVYVLVHLLHQREPAGGLDKAEYMPAYSEELPAINAGNWQSVTLPHHWKWPQTDAPELGWYRLEFDLMKDERQRLSVLLMQVSKNASVWLNGMPLDGNTNSTEERGRHWFRPLIHNLPSQDLQSGSNQLLILARATSPGKGVLGKVYVNETAQLWPAYEERHFIKVTLMHLNVILLLAISVPMALLAYWRRDDDAYFWFAVCGVLFAGATSVMSLANLPFPDHIYDWLWTTGVSSFMLAITITVHRLLDIRRTWTRPLVVIAIVGNLLLGIVASRDVMLFHILADRFWMPATIISGLYPAWLMAVKYWDEPRNILFWLLISGTLLLVTGTHDWLALGWWISPVDGFYTFIISPLLFVTFFIMLLARFHESRLEAEALNRELNERVMAKQLELERTYEELKISEQQRVLATERERIQRDMHDGLGGTLVSTLAGLEMEGASDSSAAQSLRSALDDLRLMIYSLDQSSGTLRAALGMLRERLTRLGEDAGLRIEWNVQALPTELALEQNAMLQLMRIVQEAFTNTLKHAKATTFSLTALPKTRDSREGVLLDIHDDGSGFDPKDITTGGYGLQNMRVRSQKIGGLLSFEPSSTGTSISLWVPLEHSS